MVLSRGTRLERLFTNLGALKAAGANEGSLGWFKAAARCPVCQKPLLPAEQVSGLCIGCSEGKSASLDLPKGVKEEDLGYKRVFNGVLVNVENCAGTFRYGQDPDGHEWKTKMKYDYGFVTKLKGADGEGIDVYLGPNENAKNVYVVHQVRPDTGEYDEDKVMLGFDSAAKAKKAYLEHYDSPKFFGSMSTMSFAEFKKAVEGSQTKLKFKHKKRSKTAGRLKSTALATLMGIVSPGAATGAALGASPERRLHAAGGAVLGEEVGSIIGPLVAAFAIKNDPLTARLTFLHKYRWGRAAARGGLGWLLGGMLGSGMGAFIGHG